MKFHVVVDGKMQRDTTRCRPGFEAMVGFKQFRTAEAAIEAGNRAVEAMRSWQRFAGDPMTDPEVTVVECPTARFQGCFGEQCDCPKH